MTRFMTGKKTLLIYSIKTYKKSSNKEYNTNGNL